MFYMSYHNNYGHLMGETAPLMHNLLCTYMGRWVGGRGATVAGGSECGALPPSRIFAALNLSLDGTVETF